MQTMISDDIFRTRLALTIAALRRWGTGLKEAATVEEVEGPESWRLALRPIAAAACPLEILLRRDQHFDVTIGPETYEDQLVQDLTMFEPLLNAVVEGNVVTRYATSQLTGQHRSIETVVTMAPGKTWSRRRVFNPLSEPVDRPDLVHTRHYIPYRRKETRVRYEVSGLR